MLAALFVETNGIYFRNPNIDPWDIGRDARRYTGPHSVIAHPPCERWGRFANGSPKKKTYVPGMDGGCFKAALAAVEKFGGVLEHPAHSKAWPKFGLVSPPRGGGWVPCRKGLTCSVEQGHYGHAGRKATWLYLVGFKPQELCWGASEQKLPQKRLAERGYESARRCGAIANMSSQQRQRTPAEFAALLESLVS